MPIRTLIPRIVLSFYNTDPEIHALDGNKYNFVNPNCYKRYDPEIKTLPIHEFSDIRYLQCYRELHEEDFLADYSLTQVKIIDFIDFPDLTFPTPCLICTSKSNPALPESLTIIKAITDIGYFIEQYQFLGSKILNCFNINDVPWNQKSKIVEEANKLLKPLGYSGSPESTYPCVYAVSRESLEEGKLLGKWIFPQQPQLDENDDDDFGAYEEKTTAIQQFVSELESVKVSESDTYCIISHSRYGDLLYPATNYEPDYLWFVAYLLEKYKDEDLIAHLLNSLGDNPRAVDFYLSSKIHSKYYPSLQNFVEEYLNMPKHCKSEFRSYFDYGDYLLELEKENPNWVFIDLREKGKGFYVFRD